jgi:hypothetical protein
VCVCDIICVCLDFFEFSTFSSGYTAAAVTAYPEREREREREMIGVRRLMGISSSLKYLRNGRKMMNMSAKNMVNVATTRRLLSDTTATDKSKMASVRVSLKCKG